MRSARTKPRAPVGLGRGHVEQREGLAEDRAGRQQARAGDARAQQLDRAAQHEKHILHRLAGAQQQHFGVEDDVLAVQQVADAVLRHVGEVAVQVLVGAAPEGVRAALDQHVDRAEGGARADRALLLGEAARGVREDQLARGVVAEVLRLAVDQATADVDLLDVGAHAVGGQRLRAQIRRQTVGRVVGRCELVHDALRGDVREVAVHPVAALPQRTEVQHRGLDRVRRERRPHFQPGDVVPGIELQVVHVEQPAELALRELHHGGELLEGGGAHHRDRVVGDAPVARDERGEADQVVVMAVRLEDAVDLVDADAERGQRVFDVRAGIDQVHASLEEHDAAHRRAVHVPAVAVAGVRHGEVVGLEQIVAQGVGRGVVLAGREVEVHLDRLVAVGDFEHVGAQAPQLHAVLDLDRRLLERHRLDQLLGRPDAAEGEGELHAHDRLGLLRRHAGLDQFVLRSESVVAAEQVRHLRVELVARADDARPLAGVVRVLGHQHALQVEHLQHRELGAVAGLAVLDREVGEQDGVRPALAGHALDLDWQDEAAPREVLDDVRRAAAEQAQAGVRHLDPVDAGGDGDFADGGHLNGDAARSDAGRGRAVDAGQL